MMRLAKKMELKVRQFVLQRMIHFKLNAKKELEFRGIDKRKVPFSFFKNITAITDDKKEQKRKDLKG